MKDETGGIAIKEFVRLMPKLSIEHKKAKAANKNIVATIIHGACKDVLLNKKYFETFDE